MIALERECLRIRMIELEIARRYGEHQMRQPIHLSIGQEAAAVGVCASLTRDDLMVGSHRSHAWYLAKGGSLNALIAELHGKATGCSHGHGGSMHLCDLSVGFTGSTSIVGGTIPIGVGLAWAKRLRGEAGIVVVTFGDAAVEQGVWHESANFAALHRLPVLFVCENNKYSCYTHISERQPDRPLTQLARAHGIPAIKLFSDNLANIWQTAQSAVQKVRRDGPCFLEIPVIRLFEHCGPMQEQPMEKTPDNFEFATEIAEAFRLAELAPDPKPVGMYAD